MKYGGQTKNQQDNQLQKADMCVLDVSYDAELRWRAGRQLERFDVMLLQVDRYWTACKTSG